MYILENSTNYVITSECGRKLKHFHSIIQLQQAVDKDVLLGTLTTAVHTGNHIIINRVLFPSHSHSLFRCPSSGVQQLSYHAYMAVVLNGVMDSCCFTLK